MANLAQLHISIGGDVSGLETATKKAQQELAKTAVAANKLDSSLGSGLVKGSNQAVNALTNLGRVAQDSAFGFVGIANNLNPLLESFQRLRAETGSNAGALKALGSSLMGAGGLGLGLSIVTAALSFASVGLSAWTRGMEDSTEEGKKNADAIQLITGKYEEFLKEVEKTSEAAGKEATKVSLLFGALADSNTGLGDRKRIIGQINDIIPEYLRGLDKEKASYDSIAKSVNNYTDSLALSTEVKALLPQVEKTFQGIIQAQIELNKFRRLHTRGDTGGLLGLSVADFDAEEKVFLDQIKRLKTELKHEQAGLAAIAGGGLKLTEILFGKKDDKAKDAKDVKTFSDVMAELRKELATIQQEFGAGILSPQALKTDQIQAYQKALKGLFDLGASLSQKDVIQIKVEMKPLFETAKTIDANTVFGDIFKNLGNATVPEVALNWKPKLITDITGLKDDLHPLTKELNDILNSSLQNLTASFAEGIGNLISGNGTIGDVFGNVFQVIGDGLKQMGKAMIAYGLGIEALKNAIKSPELAVVAGFGLVALGQIMKNAIPKFETGTRNFRGGLALVGEAGPELVNLPSGSDVFPNHTLGSFAGRDNGFIVEHRLTGAELLLLIKRATASQGRIG